MDPLSDVLSLLRVESGTATRFEAGGDWALRFAGAPQVKFGSIVEGECWVAAGAAAPRRVGPGDAYLLASAEPYTLASAPGLPPEDGDARWRRAVRGGVLRIGSGTVLVGGSLRLDERNAGLLLDVLPPLSVTPAGPALEASIRLLVDELGHGGIGSGLVVDHLVAIVCIHALRGASGTLDSGWLRALGDPQIGEALRLVHADPLRRWTVPELAAAVGLSRSSFAARFKALVGASPLDYVQRWRMARAAEALRRPGATATSVAFEFGYGSHSAFSQAFKRALGVSPSSHRAV